MTPPGPALRAALLALAASFGWASGPGGPVPPAWAQSPQPAAAGSPLSQAPLSQAPPSAPLSQAQLEQLLAPIALYPDSLLVEVLMASTYPLEVVQAKRWLGQENHAQLKGEALTKALEAEAWDPSVKSLVPFPDVLTMMNEQLEWTQDLGDAVLAQQIDVLNAVQVLRGRAKAAGKLETGPQQIVSVSQPAAVVPSAGAVTMVPPPPEVITIAPADPTVVYVPSYNPSVVYGSWPYPSAPPYYYPPPPTYGLGSALLTGMAFAGGVALAGSLWGWASPNWGGGSVNVNANRYNTINAGRTQINNSNWSHDVSHRQGVAYRDQATAERMRGASGGGAAANRAQSREQFRGRTEQVQRGASLDTARGDVGNRAGAADRASAGGDDRGNGGNRTGGAGSGDRGNVGTRAGGAGGGDRGNVGNQRGGANQVSGNRSAGGARGQQQASARPSASPQRQGGSAAFQGMGQGANTRVASQRGASSRQSATASRGGGGERAAASRGGGGGGGGRGRR